MVRSVGPGRARPHLRLGRQCEDMLRCEDRRRAEGIFAAPFERGEIGPDAACRMGLEGLVSKHRERAYRGGRCDHWIKVKNRAHPAFARVRDQFGVYSQSRRVSF